MDSKYNFTNIIPYKKTAKYFAIVWTILILIGCFAPAASFPVVDIPFVDKWVHFIMFGVFAFLWLSTNEKIQLYLLIKMLFICTVFGAFIELMQGLLTFLNRSMEFMDAVADMIGGILGICFFCLLNFVLQPKQFLNNSKP